MSVLFRNMRMPKECRICPMLGYESDIGRTRCAIACRILSEHYKPIPFDGRPEWCPASEVAVPHGDLIDRNEFLVKMNLAIALIKTGMVVLDAKDDKELKMELKTYLDIRDGLKECDVVIEAEGAEE